jgi:(R,R)-butanediol dehydrogenase/meso-butanediol dehydrogenase/diacetyl reductase
LPDQDALVWLGGKTAAVVPVPVPEPRPGWVPVDVAYAGICGTDLHIVAGEHVRARPGIVLGHELVGRLAAPVGDLRAGQPVFVNPMVHCGTCEACLAGRINACRRLTSVGIDYPGAVAARTVVPEYGLYPLPADTDLATAALIEPVAVAVRAVRRAGLRVGERAHVVGGGPVGLLVALVATAAGAAVTLSEPSDDRRRRVTALGVAVVAGPDDLDQPADVVFDATGHPAVASALLSWPRVGGRAVVVGAYPSGLHGLDLHRLMFAELTVVGTRIYLRSDIEAAIDLVTAGRLDVRPVVSRIAPLHDAVAAVDGLRRGEGMKVLIEPGRLIAGDR